MARGFNATLGVGVTDSVQTTYATSLAVRTIAMWVKPRVGQTGANNLVDKRSSASTDVEQFYFGSATQLNVDFGFDGGSGHWHTAAVPTTGFWGHVAFSYDNSLTANDPIFYVNGTLQATVRDTGPIGTAKTTAETYRFGNWGSSDAPFDGQIAECAIWSVALTQGEISELAAGVRPIFIRPASLVEYVPLIKDNVSLKNAAPTVTGTQVQPHAPILYSRGPLQIATTDAVGADAFQIGQSDAFQGGGYYLQAQKVAPFQSDAFQIGDYKQPPDIRTVFQPDAFQDNVFQIDPKILSTGTASITLGALTLTATGKVKAQGSLNVTLADLTVSATGIARATGRLSVVLDDLTLNATGHVPNPIQAFQGFQPNAFQSGAVYRNIAQDIKAAFQPNAFQSDAFQETGQQPPPEVPPETTTAAVPTGSGYKSVRDRQLEQIYQEDEEILEILRRFIYDKAA